MRKQYQIDAIRAGKPKESKFKKFVIMVEQVVLYTAIVAGIGFYFGTQFQAKQTAHTQAVVQDAVKALAPVAQAGTVPKN